MQKLLDTFERVVISVLILLMALVVILATLDVAWTILQAVLRPPYLFLAADDLLSIFAAFLLVLVGMELLDTIKAYLQDHIVHAEIVFMAAMIAVARKVIVIDIKAWAPETMFGIAALILALTAGYFLFKRVQPAPHVSDKSS